MGRLSGKGALIIGAGTEGNIGQVIARRFIAEGARVVVAGRAMQELERFATEVGAVPFASDITDKASVVSLANFTRETFGHLDIAVNSTGWGLMSPFLKNSTEDLKRICDLQFVGPFQFFQAVIEAMDRGGSLIQITSAVATIMLNNHAAYMGTKAGFDHVMRVIAHEFGSRGIRANSIAPGLTNTPMSARGIAMPGLQEAFLPGYPLGRIGTADDIAASAVWLAEDECFMTGQTLQVNGGLTLRRNPTQDEIEASMALARK